MSPFHLTLNLIQDQRLGIQKTDIAFAKLCQELVDVARIEDLKNLLDANCVI